MIVETGGPNNLKDPKSVAGLATTSSAGNRRPGYINQTHRDLNRSILLGIKQHDVKDYFDGKGNTPILAHEFSFEAVTLAKIPLGIKKLSQDPSSIPKCFLLPYIGQACYFHKNIVYLWSYKTEKFHFFETLAGNITSVGLVKPKKDVFPSVTYLLVVATTSAVELYPLNLGADEAVLLYTSDHKMSSNGYSITSITGSQAGRIFMGSKRGDILELNYQLSDSTFPFSKKMSLTNCTRSFFAPLSLIWPSSPAKEIVSIKIDEERKTLYSLSLDSTIQIINLGQEGDSFGLVGDADLGKPIAQKQLGLRDEALLTPIVDMHVVPTTDSFTLRLVAIAASGISLYYRSAKQANPNQATGLALDFVRPSTYTSFLLNDSRGFASLYRRGILISATPSGANASTISTTFVEGTPASKDNLAVLARTLNVGALLMDIQEQDLALQCYTTKAISPHLPGFDDVVSQYYSPARKFNMITKEGVVQLIKLRPVDQLFKDLSKDMSTSRSVADLRRRFGPTECCAMILSLLSEYPLALPETDCSQDFMEDHHLPQFMKDRLTLAFKELAGSPRVQNARALVHSDGFAGALIFFSRLLTPVWNSRIVALSSSKPICYDLAISEQTLRFAKRALDKLISLCSQIPALSAPLIPPSGDEEDLTDPLMAERRSLYSLNSLMMLSSQALGFLLLLSSYPIDTITKKLPPILLNQLLECTLEALITSPSHLEIIHELSKLMMDNFLVSIPRRSQSVYDFLKEQCKELCNLDKLPMLKGFELLKEVKGMPKAKMLLSLKHAQNHFMNLKHALPLTQITDILRQYQEIGFQLGSLDLIASNASKLSPLTPDSDNYYSLVNIPLDSIRRALQSSPLVCPEQPDLLRGLKHLLESVHDKRFHKAIYDWFLNHNLPMLLYEICSPFFLDYLATSPIVDKMAARCCYFVSKGMYCAAARYLFECAVDEDNHDLTLHRRVELLNQAKGYTENNNTSDSAPNFFQLGKEIKTYLQAAIIQLKVVEEYSELHSEDQDFQVLDKLNAKLFPIQELYSNFVCPLNLPQAKRSIIDKDPLIRI